MKEFFKGATLAVEADGKLEQRQSMTGRLKRTAENEFCFQESEISWIGHRSTHRVFRRKNLRITLNENGYYRVSITLKEGMSARAISDYLYEKTEEAVGYFERKEASLRNG